MKGKTIVVLESRAGEQFVAALTRRGAATIWAPALVEAPDVDPAEIRRLVDEWDLLSPALAIFQTGVGTAALFEATDSLGLTDRLISFLRTIPVVCRGPKPTAALGRWRVRVDLAAAPPFTTREILDAIRDIPISRRTVLVQRYGDSNQELLAALRARGAVPREVATYKWAMPADTAPLERAIDAIISGEADAVAFTSAVQARNLISVATDTGRRMSLIHALNATLVASIGPVCSAALRDLGITPQLEATPPKLGYLVSALDSALSRTQ